MYKFGYKFDDVDNEGRNCAFFATINEILHKNKIFNFLKEYTNLLDA